MPDDFDNEEAARRAQAAADGTMRDVHPDGDESEQSQGELFPTGVMDGGGKTLKTLIKAGQPVRTTVALSRAEVPLRNGLPDPDKHVRALVTGVFANAKESAIREDEANPMKVTSWKVAVSMRVDYVEAVPDTDEGLIEQRFRAMLEVDTAAAGALLERLAALAAKQLQLA